MYYSFIQSWGPKRVSKGFGTPLPTPSRDPRFGGVPPQPGGYPPNLGWGTPSREGGLGVSRGGTPPTPGVPPKPGVGHPSREGGLGVRFGGVSTDSRDLVETSKKVPFFWGVTPPKHPRFRGTFYVKIWGVFVSKKVPKRASKLRNVTLRTKTNIMGRVFWGGTPM